jgi:hypothetical protein
MAGCLGSSWHISVFRTTGSDTYSLAVDLAHQQILPNKDALRQTSGDSVRPAAAPHTHTHPTSKLHHRVRSQSDLRSDKPAYASCRGAKRIGTDQWFAPTSNNGRETLGLRPALRQAALVCRRGRGRGGAAATRQRSVAQQAPSGTPSEFVLHSLSERGARPAYETFPAGTSSPAGR